MTEIPESAPTLTRCRVTANVLGARAGSYVLVDLDDPANKGYLIAEVIVPEPLPQAKAEGEREAGVEGIVARPLSEVIADVAQT